MAWNFDMNAAPKGRTEIRTQKGPKGETKREVHVPDTIIVADRDSDVVTLSRWLPKEGRWNMFPKGAEPLAWQPFPRHPKFESD